jgi:hypothetical protein
MVIFPEELRTFVDAEGRLRQWPSRRKQQLVACAALAAAVPAGQSYTEREMNELLNSFHTFGDPALLRRILVDLGYLVRTSDGRTYERAAGPPVDSDSGHQFP